MVYDPTKDFVGLWRNTAGQLSKEQMPGLDFVVAALARAGLITLSVSATPPVVSQSTTAWLQAAVPSYSAEGVLHLWDPDTSAYVLATQALLFEMLQTAAGASGVSWWVTAGGPPANVIGGNGDFAIRTDEPGGVFGPKALDVWPATPLPGTTNMISSAELDNTFGTDPGLMIYRGAAAWQALPIGADGTVLTALGSVPTWDALSLLLDAVFGGTQGSILFRNAALWSTLPPGAANDVLSSGGPAANPAWAARTAEFGPGTRMLFNQSVAPTGWTKSIAVNDAGIRVVSGSVGTVAGTPFSTVFAQTAVGNTTLSVAQMPSHGHTTNAPVNAGTQSDLTPGSVIGVSGTAVVNANGGSTSHTHSIQLQLAYVDVIIASKDA